MTLRGNIHKMKSIRRVLTCLLLYFFYTEMVLPSLICAAPSRAKTFIKVETKAPRATVTIDGIFAGYAGSLIEVDPGQASITIAANGYRAISVKVKIAANKTTTLKANLKPIPQKKRPSASSNARRQNNRANTKANKSELFSEKDPLALPPGRDLTREFSGDAAGYPASSPAQSMYAQPPAQPTYAYPPQPAYPVYPYPPPVQQPMYVPVPQPAPTYALPPPPVYNPPPDPGFSDPGFASPSPRKEKPKNEKTDKQVFIALLPFGAGQFQNEKYILGTAFAAAQAGALYYWYYNNSLADQTIAQTERVKNERNMQEDRMTRGQEQATYRLETEAFVTKRNEEITALYSQADYGLYAFAGLWAVGIFEAMFNEPPPKMKKSRRSKRGFSLNYDRLDPNVLESDASEGLAMERLVVPEWSFGLDSTLVSVNHSLRPAFGLRATLDF